MSLMNSSWLAKIRSDKYMHHPNSDRANKKNQFPKCLLCRLSHLIAATHHLIAIRAVWQKCNERWSMSDICQFTALRCVGRPNNFVLLHFVPLFRLKHMLFLFIVLKSSIIILIYAFLNLSLSSKESSKVAHLAVFHLKVNRSNWRRASYKTNWAIFCDRSVR